MSEKYSIKILADLSKLQLEDQDIKQSFDDVVTWCESLKKVPAIEGNTLNFSPNPKLNLQMRKDDWQQSELLISKQKIGEYFITKKVVKND